MFPPAERGETSTSLDHRLGRHREGVPFQPDHPNAPALELRSGNLFGEAPQIPPVDTAPAPSRRREPHSGGGANDAVPRAPVGRKVETLRRSLGLALGNHLPQRPFSEVCQKRQRGMPLRRHTETGIAPGKRPTLQMGRSQVRQKFATSRPLALHHQAGGTIVRRVGNPGIHQKLLAHRAQTAPPLGKHSPEEPGHFPRTSVRSHHIGIVHAHKPPHQLPLFPSPATKKPPSRREGGKRRT